VITQLIFNYNNIGVAVFDSGQWVAIIVEIGAIIGAIITSIKLLKDKFKNINNENLQDHLDNYIIEAEHKFAVYKNPTEEAEYMCAKLETAKQKHQYVESQLRQHDLPKNYNLNKHIKETVDVFSRFEK
jgi:uncharacterized membrane protein YciS (DUF1049 family)